MEHSPTDLPISTGIKEPELSRLQAEVTLSGKAVLIWPNSEGVVVGLDRSTDEAALLELAPLDRAGQPSADSLELQYSGERAQWSRNGELMLLADSPTEGQQSILMRAVAYSPEAGRFSVDPVVYTAADTARGLRALMVSARFAAVEEIRGDKSFLGREDPRKVVLVPLDSSSRDTVGPGFILKREHSLLTAQELDDGKILVAQKSLLTGSYTVACRSLDGTENKSSTEYRGEYVQFGSKLSFSANGESVIEWDRNVLLARCRVQYSAGVGSGYQDRVEYTAIEGLPRVTAAAVSREGDFVAAAFHDAALARSELRMIDLREARDTRYRYGIPEASSVFELPGRATAIAFDSESLHVLVSKADKSSAYLKFGHAGK